MIHDVDVVVQVSARTVGVCYDKEVCAVHALRELHSEVVHALDADLIVLSTGIRPDTAFAEAAGIETSCGYILVDEHGRTSADDVYAVGDTAVGRGHDRPVTLAGPANRRGRLVADAIADAEHGEADALQPARGLFPQRHARAHPYARGGRTERSSVRKPWSPTAWTAASASSQPPCEPA